MRFSSPELGRIKERLTQHMAALGAAQADISTYLRLHQQRHDQLTRRVERLENQVDHITNPETARNRKLLADYERLSEAHSQSEEALDDLENLVLEPLWEAQEVLQRLVS